MIEEDEREQWYVRRGSTIQGPYDVEQLRRYLLLGRVRLTDRASRDGESWYAITQCPALIPAEMRDLDSEEGRARFEAARRAVDERQRPEAMPGGERADDLPPRAASRRWAVLALALIVAIALVLVEVYGNLSADPEASTDCGAVASPGVNWNYCNKDGMSVPPGTDLGGASGVNGTFRDAQLAGVVLSEAVLSYADLSGADLHDADLTGADLTGANLRGADLTGAILRDADLTHADLRGARLDGARMDGAQREHAAWTDGQPCGRERVAECRP